MEPEVGIEPTAPALQKRCSATELLRRGAHSTVRRVCNPDNMEHPKDIGDRSTLAVMAALQRLGYGLYLPFGENTRCDLVLEAAGKLVRLQCKTGRLRDGAVAFSVCSNYGHHRNPETYHRDTRAGRLLRRVLP